MLKLKILILINLIQVYNIIPICIIYKMVGTYIYHLNTKSQKESKIKICFADLRLTYCSYFYNNMSSKYFRCKP